MRRARCNIASTDAVRDLQLRSRVCASAVLKGRPSTLAQHAHQVSLAGAPAFVEECMQHGPAPKLLTLVLINDGQRVLLGEKKRGFGKGYFNGFGGKVEPGETILQAAKRELLEEACITAPDMHEVGVLTFVFNDQPMPWEVHVFGATGFQGTPMETDEMKPQWFSYEDIPYDKMWADDLHWYPLFLEGRQFTGVFAFEHATQLVWHALAS